MLTNNLNFKPQLMIIGIDYVGKEFKTYLESLSSELESQTQVSKVLPVETIILSIFQESVMQVFDCMNIDYAVFVNSVLQLPKLDRFNCSEIFNNSEIRDNFVSEFKKFAIGIWFEMRNQNLLFPKTIYIVDNPTFDYITCALYPL